MTDITTVAANAVGGDKVYIEDKLVDINATDTTMG